VAEKKRLLEGFTNTVSTQIRQFFARAPEMQASALKRGGNPSVERAGLPYNLVSQFGGDGLAEHLRIDQDLQARYTDAEEMDEYPEIASSLDIYADDSTTPNMEEGQSVWVQAEDKTISDDLNDMLHKRVLIDDDAWGLARQLGKYGNAFGEMLVSQQGLIGINYIAPPTVRRVEGPKGELLGFVQDVRGEFNLSLEDFYQLAKNRDSASVKGRAPGELTVFEDWEVLHWRLRGKHLRSVYGHGVIDPARWIWKRLNLLEDALLIYKLSRAPSRYAFYIDTGELDHERGMAFVNRVKNQFTKKRFVNPSTGKIDMRYNPLCLRGDTQVPLLDGTTKTLVEMTEAYERGEEQWVYSSDLDDQGRVRPGKVAWAGKTRRDAELVRVTLDNGQSVVVTPDHKMIRRSGEKVQAQELLPGDSLMPYRSRVSSKAKGEALEGYDLTYCPKAQKSLYTHRFVARDLGIYRKGEVIHHSNLQRMDNAPGNLTSMDPLEHRALHIRLGQAGGKAVAMLRKVDSGLDARLREASTRNITRYNKSESKRMRTSVLNKERDQGRFIREYNVSEKHSKDNVARSRAMSGMWSDKVRRDQAASNMRIKFPPIFIEGLFELIRQNPTASMDEIAGAATDALATTLNAANTRNVKSIHRHMLRKVALEQGYSDFGELRKAAVDDNHKVVSVEWLSEREDTYTLTVEPAHTFAVSAGVFVCNSHDEDFFIPTSGGKDSTRIEVLNGPDYAETDTLEYHRDKLVAALKIPKVYLGFGGESTKSSLSTEDIRFARTIMRIQKEMRSGYKKACRVHLVASGADPDAIDYDVMMEVPSAILELAKVEVMSATSDLAQRMGEYVSTKWMLTSLFEFTDTEAERVMKEREKETLEKGKIEAKIQGLLAKAQMGGEEAAMPAEDEPPPPAETKATPPAKEGLSRRDLHLMEQRLARVLQQREEATQRNFDRKMDSRWKAEDKARELIRDDPAFKRRISRVEALVGEIRGSMRS